MKFSNWTYESFKRWVDLLPSSSLMDCHNTILVSGEIIVDNSNPKEKSDNNEIYMELL